MQGLWDHSKGFQLFEKFKKKKKKQSIRKSKWEKKPNIKKASDYV